MAEIIPVTVLLPAELERDARELGILDDATVIQLLRKEVDRRVNELVNEEIHAYRREKRAASSDKA